jgi:hypothetical protein
MRDEVLGEAQNGVEEIFERGVGGARQAQLLDVAEFPYVVGVGHFSSSR